jgi:single-strand DNA-binding protein
VNETTVTITGNMVTDVDLRQTSRGDAMARFRVASTVKRWERSTERWVEGDTTYWTVTAWRRTAENAAASLAKGQPVVVHGRLRQRIVDRPVPGSPGASVSVTYTDVDAVSLGLDLSRCRSAFVRAPIGPQTGQSHPVGAVGAGHSASPSDEPRGYGDDPGSLRGERIGATADDGAGGRAA